MEPPASFFPSKLELLKLVSVLAIATAIAVSCNLIASYLNPRSKPFCDSDLDAVDFLADSCEPCPSHGECHEGILECHHGYRKQGNLCVEDSDIHATAKQLSEWIESRLCEAYAQFLCYGTGTVWIQAEDISNNLDEQLLMKRLTQDSAVYMYTKQRAVETIMKSLETRLNSAGMKEFKCPDSLAQYYKPYGCRIRHWIVEHALLLIPVCALIVGSAVLMQRIRKRHQLLTRVEELYHQVCDILEENAMSSKRNNGESEPWVVAPRLRDHLLSPKERKDPLIWRKVEALIQEDSRVDQYPKLVKGESKVVWEWQVEGSLSSARVRKKVETSKLKSTSQDMNSYYHERHYEPKAEPRALIF